MLTIFMFESQFMQMPGPRDIVIYRSGPREFSVVQRALRLGIHFGEKALGGMVTGQIDACITNNDPFA